MAFAHIPTISSHTSRTSSPVSAEHSAYRSSRSCRATANPSCGITEASSSSSCLSYSDNECIVLSLREIASVPSMDTPGACAVYGGGGSSSSTPTSRTTAIFACGIVRMPASCASLSALILSSLVALPPGSATLSVGLARLKSLFRPNNMTPTPSISSPFCLSVLHVSQTS